MYLDEWNEKKGKGKADFFQEKYDITFVSRPWYVDVAFTAIIMI